MNLKQQISKFRSQILIGKYESAIKMAKPIIAQIQLLQTLQIGDFTQLRHSIQMEYQKCLTLNSITKYQHVSEEEPVKKWGTKTSSEKVSKWNKKEESNMEESMVYKYQSPKQKEPFQIGNYLSPIKYAKEEDQQYTNEKMEQNR